MTNIRAAVAQKHNDLISAILKLAGLGYYVVPLAWITDSGSCSCYRSKTCTAPGKHPLVKGWRHEATTDPQKIKRWWDRWLKAGVGIATGRGSNLIVVDVDPR